jgi:hypothetical protein
MIFKSFKLVKICLMIELKFLARNFFYILQPFSGPQHFNEFFPLVQTWRDSFFKITETLLL